MRKLFFALCLITVASVNARAQLTTVSGTVMDSDSVAWAGGSWQAVFVPSPNQSNLNAYTIGGVAITSPTYTQYLSQSGSLSGGAGFSFTALDNSRITPVGSQLKITFCPLATSKCGSLTMPVSGPSITIGTPTITGAIQAPRFQGVAGSYGYADVEAQLQVVPGSTYYNVAVGCQRYYDPNTSTWTCYASSGTLITPPADLQTVITNGGTNFDVWLSCGTFNVPSGLIINNPGVHLHGQSKECTFINFTSSVGLTVNSVAGFSAEKIHWEGATSGWTIKIATASPVTRFTDSIISGAGSFGGALTNSTALWVQAPNSDITVDHVEFTGNGVAGNSGYIVRTDGAAAGYVQRFHFNYNWIHNNVSPDPVYVFDVANSDITNNTINQGNNCGGTLCNNPAGNGVSYSISAYSEGYAITINTIIRVSGVVTVVLPTAFAPSWPLQVGDDILEELALPGTNGTDFNGVFKVASISVDRKTITWNQTGIPDDTGTGFGPPYANGLIIPPLQNVTISNNTITNSSGACIYLQGMSNVIVSNNSLTQCDLQSQAGGHPQSAIGVNGSWGGSITGNGIDGVGLTHGIAVQNGYFVTVSGNTIANIPAGMGVNIYDSAHLTVGDNTIHDAQTGIGTSAGTTPNCFHCSFPGNTIRMLSNGPAYSFAAQDKFISITGGSVHAPSTGLSNSAIGLGALTSDITVSGLTINCQPDFATAATATVFYGIRMFVGSSHNKLLGNNIKGCNQGGAAGIADFGDDDVINGNTVTAGTYGILASTGNRPLVTNNIVWGNSTALNLTSTGAFSSGNQTSQTGGIGNYNVTGGYLVNGNLVLPSFLVGYQGTAGTKVGLTDGGSFTSGALRKTAGDGSETDAPTLLASGISKLTIDCATTAVCTNSIPTNPWTTYGGPIAMTAGTITITGIAPAYTSNVSYRCMSWDVSVPANTTSCSRVSGSSITITGTGGDNVTYILIGN